MVGNARVAESAGAAASSNPEHSGAATGLSARLCQPHGNVPPGSHPEHSGAGAGPGTACQALPAAWKRTSWF